MIRNDTSKIQARYNVIQRDTGVQTKEMIRTDKEAGPKARAEMNPLTS